MNQAQNDLDALRREIDSIDDRMHDMIMRRAEIVQRIATVKGVQRAPGSVIRPGREAQILRRILGRHRGVLPKAVVARIWRELIAALCRVQGPLAIAVLAPEKSVGYSDMARRHYGSTAQMSLYRSGSRVLRAVAEVPGTVGILPLPQDGDDEPWWAQIAMGDGDRPQVIAKLPFAPAGEGRFESLNALVISDSEAEPSGADESLIAIRLAEPISRARLAEIVRQAGFAARTLAVQTAPGLPELHLLAVDGFVTADDVRLGQVVDLSGGAVQRAKRLGAYALPIED